MSEPLDRVEIAEFEPAHATAVAGLCDQMGWTSFADPDTVRTACTAPGVVARVAVDGEQVVGFAQAFGDGVVQSYLSNLVVAGSHRHRGIARRLTEATFAATGTKRMDAVSDDAADGFYQTLPHKTRSGFRIYPDRTTVNT